MKFYVYEVEMFNWRDQRYFMSTKEKCLARKLNEIFFPRNGKLLTGKLPQILRPRP